MKQSITTIECHGCGTISHGLSHGPNEAVRLSMWNSKYTNLCRKCTSPDVEAIREAQVDRYYYEKAVGGNRENGH